ncbi:MAG: hypothetical protein ACRC1P_11220 [Cellulosilyticaceae bacterium]
MKQITFDAYTGSCAVISPYYDAQRQNCTYTILDTGEAFTIPLAFQRFMESLHTDPRISYASNLNYSRTYLRGKRNLPLILDDQHVYFTHKARENADKQHPCYGYISLFAVKDLIGTDIQLINGLTISTYSTRKMLIDSIYKAYTIYLQFTHTYQIASQLPLHTHQLIQRLI